MLCVYINMKYWWRKEQVWQSIASPTHDMLHVTMLNEKERKSEMAQSVNGSHKSLTYPALHSIKSAADAAFLDQATCRGLPQMKEGVEEGCCYRYCAMS